MTDTYEVKQYSVGEKFFAGLIWAQQQKHTGVETKWAALYNRYACHQFRPDIVDKHLAVLLGGVRV